MRFHPCQPITDRRDSLSNIREWPDRSQGLSTKIVSHCSSSSSSSSFCCCYGFTFMTSSCPQIHHFTPVKNVKLVLCKYKWHPRERRGALYGWPGRPRKGSLSGWGDNLSAPIERRLYS